MIKKKTWILVIGILVALIIGGIVGANLFAKTKIVNVPTDDGEFCYDDDQLFYSANNLNFDPMNSYGFVSEVHCKQENPSSSKCYISEYNPNLVNNKVICVCRK